MERNKQMWRNIFLSTWYDLKQNNLVAIAIFFLYNKMLSGHEKVKMVLEMKF